MKELTIKKLGPIGAMICGSKSGYHRMYPNNFTIFNANVCTKEDGKIWYGDIDITLSKDKLHELAIEINKDIYVLYESDARFENENNPIFDRYTVVFKANGTYEINEQLQKYYKL